MLTCSCLQFHSTYKHACKPATTLNWINHQSWLLVHRLWTPALSKYSTDYSTRSQSVVDRMNHLFLSFQEHLSTPDFVVIHELWPRFPTISSNAFSIISPSQPCLLADSNIQPTGILKELCDTENLSWNTIESLLSPRILKVNLRAR